MSFDPTGYSGYLGHTDVQAGVNVYTDVAGTTLTSTDGAAVRYLRRNAGTAGDFVGNVSWGAPALKLGVRPTGLDALRWDGVDDLLKCVDSAIVNLFKGDTQDFSFYMAIGRVTNPTLGQITMSWNPSGDTGNYGYLRVDDSGTRVLSYRDYDDSTPATRTGTVGSGSGNWAIVWGQYNGTTKKYVVGINTSAGTEVTSGVGHSTINQVVLGGLVRSGFANGQSFHAFDLGTLCWYNALHSSTTRLAIINGLAADSLGAPAAPTSPVATAIYKGVHLDWTGSTGVTSYLIERSADGSTGWTQIGTTTSKLYYADTERPTGTTYYYRIKASNFAGTSSASSTVSATTLSTLTSAAHISPKLYDWWKPDGLSSGAVSSWAGSVNSKALVQGTGANQPTRSANSSGTAPYFVSFDGTNDYLTHDAAGPVFEGDFSIAYVSKLGSMSGRTANQNRWIADKSGTNNQTLDEFAQLSSGCAFHSDCRLNDGTTEYSIGGYPIDTAVHFMGMCANTDGLARSFYDGTLSGEKRIRPAGGALTFDMWTIGAHRRVTIDAYGLLEYGDIYLYQCELNADQWGYLQQLGQPRYNTPSAAPADPLNLIDGLSGRWARAIDTAAGGGVTDGTALANNYQWIPRFRYLAELTNGTSTVTYETNESPTGKAALAIGASGMLQEVVAGNISGELDGGTAFSVFLVAKANSLSGSAQTVFCLTNNGATNAYVALRANASGQWELSSRDNSNNDYSGSGGAADTSIHAFLVIFDGDRTLTLYVDGRLVITLTLSASTVWTFTRYVLGGLYRGSLSEGFTGLRIFHTEEAAKELSSTERSALFGYAVTEYGTPLAPQAAAPAFYYARMRGL